jgi:acyl carrier protein
MNRKKILEKLEIIFRIVFEDNSLKIREEMTTNDIERWDSLSHLLMFKEIESNFNIKFNIMEMADIRKIGDIIDKIQIKLR